MATRSTPFQEETIVKRDQTTGSFKDTKQMRKSVRADTKDALLTADKWFRAASDASFDSLFVAKGVRDEAGQLIDFECVDVNGTALQSLGLTKESVIGQKLWGLLAVNRETFFDKYSQVLSTGSPLEEEFLFDAAQARWLRHQVVRAGDGIAVFSRDVTLRKEAESKLENSEKQLRLVMSVAHMGAWTFDTKDQTFSLSEGTDLVLGLPPGEGPRTTDELVEAVYPADRDMVVRVMAESRENGTPLRTEFRITWPDGTIHWVNVQSDLIRDEQGVSRLSLGIVMDITERKKADQKFKDLLESTPEAMVIVNHDGEIVLVNAMAIRLFGWCRDELLGQKVDMLMPERFRGRHPGHQSSFYAQTQARPMGAELQLFGLRKDGTEFPAEVSLSPLETGEGQLVMSTIRDITERKAAKETIRRLNRVYAVLSGINALSVRVRERGELFTQACRIAVEAGGFRMAVIGIVDQSSMKIVPVASAGVDDEFLSAIKSFFSSGQGTPEANNRVARAIKEKKVVVADDLQSDPRVVFRKEYSEFGVRSGVFLPLVVADEAVGVLALYADETEFFQGEELKLLTELAGDIAFAIDHLDKQDRLDYFAFYDVLTGFANRTLFLDRLALYIRNAVSGGHKLALYLIDLERFKNINDSLGRPAGDALLRQVAEWLTRNTEDANLLARVGSDHFAMVLPEVKQEADVARLLEKMMADFLDHPFLLNDTEFRIAAKVGVTLFPDDGADADTLFKNAEAALKRAKASGERYLFYRSKMTEMVAGKLALENQLRRALDNEEFVLYYQPKVNLASGKLTGAEALIRWNDPLTGLVPPGRFIPILEETGLIQDVGRWALRQAIKDYLRWRSMGLPAVRIAVNVSPLQLRHRDFVDEVRQVIDIDPSAAAGLELEITESVIMEDVEHCIASLKTLRAAGISIAIDDFGTGFSSLAYLAKLPMDTLKIDLSFVRNMTTGPQGLALVSTIISLAHALKLKVVAEGVETEEQRRLLHLLGCDEMQGYLFSKPVPSEIFEAKFLAPASEA